MIIKKEQGEILNYLEDASNLQGGSAESVFIPDSEEEIAKTVRECGEKNLPLTISAGGTGVVGGRIPFGGVVLSVEKLNKIIEINKKEKYAVLQAGVIIDDFLKELSKQNLFYPPFPTERTAFIGGNVATNASGEYSFRFGSTREYVRGIKVILSNGKIIRIKRGEVLTQGGFLQIPSTDIRFKIPGYRMPPVKKNSAGYYSRDAMDLIDLFIGSEGTLGIIIEVEVTIIEQLPDTFFCALFFRDPQNAFSIVKELTLSPTKYKGSNGSGKNLLDELLCLEYFDNNSLNYLRKFYPRVAPEAEACILVAVQMSSPESLNMWDGLLTRFNTIDNWFGDSQKQKEELFAFRHKLPEIINDITRKNNCPKISTDIVTPENNFWQMNDFYCEKLNSSNLKYVTFGHIGECHLHVNLLPENEEELQMAKELYLEFAQKAIELNGTISGEHGIGKSKHRFLKIMYGEKGIREMTRVKTAIDRNCILGLDNIFPRTDITG